MTRRKLWITAGIAACVAVGVVLTIAATSSDAPRTLKEAEVKGLLRQLPYRFEFRQVRVPPGASGAVAGRAVGPHRTIVHFGISLGRNSGRVPLGPGTEKTDAIGGATFRVANDVYVIIEGKMRAGQQIHTAAQETTAIQMVVDIEEKLCRATTGQPCEI